MNRSARMIALTGLLVVLVGGGVSYAYPTWPTELGVDFWNVSDLKTRLQRENRWREQLEALDTTVMQRIRIKETIIRDVLARRMSLVEAAAAFRELNADKPIYMDVLRTTYEARND